MTKLENYNNKYAQKWDEESKINAFIEALEYAESNKECLSLEDAINHCNMPYSTYYSFANSDKVLEAIKKDTQKAVNRRINRGVLIENMNPTGAIWRMKQLGEKDRQEITNLNHEMQPLTSEEIKQAKDKLNDKLDDY
jgi:hypothetical protein